MTTPAPQTKSTHVRPNYMLIWLYLFLMTIVEVLLAFELPVSQNVKLILLLIMAVWKALLVALFFMHLKFERWRLRLIFVVPIPLALILITVGILEKIW
jgi:cytochrome c oxidase subunit IV